MSLTERLANLSTVSVIIIVIVLLAIRWILLKQRTPAAKSVAEIAEQLAFALGLVFLIIRPFIVQAFFIPSGSMIPTLEISDHIFVNKFIYRFHEPRRGDIIVFRAPIQATPDVQAELIQQGADKGLEGKELERYVAREAPSHEKDFIKRVIGVPGDVVRITPGYVIVGETSYNHRELESFLRGSGDMEEPARVKLSGKQVYVDGQPVSNDEVAAAVGDPNAKVKVVPGKVYINGKALTEPYTAEDPDDPYPQGSRVKVNQKYIVVDKANHQEVKIPKGKLLVLGDNRNNSFDSRYWGLLDRSRVQGKAMFIFYPLGRIRWIH